MDDGRPSDMESNLCHGKSTRNKILAAKLALSNLIFKYQERKRMERKQIIFMIFFINYVLVDICTLKLETAEMDGIGSVYSKWLSSKIIEKL